MWRRHDTFDSYPTMMLLWQENEENTTSEYLPEYQTNNIRTDNYRSKRFSLKIHFFDIFTYNIYIDTYCKYMFNNFHSIKKKSFQSCDDIKIHENKQYYHQNNFISIYKKHNYLYILFTYCQQHNHRPKFHRKTPKKAHQHQTNYYLQNSRNL